MSSEGEREEAMFWRLMRQALYDDLGGKPPAKLNLTDEQVEELRTRYAHGASQGVLAREFGISQPRVSEYVRGVVRLFGRGSGVRIVDPASAEFGKLMPQMQARIYRHRFGWKMQDIQDEFGISRSTAKRWVNPEFAQRHREKDRLRWHERYKRAA